MKTNQLDLSLEETPEGKNERLQSTRSKVFHNHPLSDIEIQDVKTALNSHSEFTEQQIDLMLKKLKLQQTKPMDSALTLDERNAVDISIESLQAEI